MQRFGGVFGVAIATAVFTADGHLGTPASFNTGLKARPRRNVRRLDPRRNNRARRRQATGRSQQSAARAVARAGGQHLSTSAKLRELHERRDAMTQASHPTTQSAPPTRDRFEGFDRTVFDWFAGLERDNSKAYFKATRERYEIGVRAALEAMLYDLANTFGGEVKMFRQHRDVRFSADKSPYKTTTYGLLSGIPETGAGLYAQLSSRGLYAGTGEYHLERDQLERYRDAVIDERAGPQLAQAAQTAEHAGLELAGETLSTTPRGYPREHPRIELLRRKALIVGRALPSAAGISRDAALKHAAATWRAAAPLNAWFDEHVGAGTIPAKSHRRS